MIERLPVCALQGQQLQKQPLLFSPGGATYTQLIKKENEINFSDKQI